MSIDKGDSELVERVVYKAADDIAVSVARSFERLEERLDAAEARIYGRLAEVEDKIEASRQDLRDELGEVREDIRRHESNG